jgi:hypothetical protein
MRVPNFIILLLVLVTTTTNAQTFIPLSYSVKDSVYVQNFDGLPSSGSFSLSGKGPHDLSNTPMNSLNMAGWQFFAHLGSTSNAVFAVSTGSATGQGVYSLGASGSSDRALGSLASSTGIYSFGIVLINHTGSTLNQVTISFNAEQWRKGGSTNKNFWKCFYKTGTIPSINQSNKIESKALGFSSLQTTSGSATLNGNLPENKQSISGTITGIDWKAGEQLLIVWEDADETGSDDMMAIDDFSLKGSFVQTNSNTVDDIVALANNPTHADTIQYHVSLSGNTSGLTNSNFSLITNGITNASITKIEGSGKSYTATVYTGAGSGYINLGISNNANIIPGLSNTPFYSIDTQWIDKVKPIQTSFTHGIDTLLKQNDTLQLLLQFNEPVYLDTSNGFSYIPITIGSRVKNIVYTNGNGTNTLKFTYTVQSGEVDKDGIRVASAFNAGNLSVKDEAGNIATLTINSTPIQKIKVDAIAPEFTQATDTTIQFCSSTSIAIGSLLKVNNKEANEILQWKLIKQPSNYQITKQVFDSSAASTTFQPNGFSISNPNNSSSIDTCIFSISDGINTAIKKIIFSVSSSYQWNGSQNEQWTNIANWCNNTIPPDSASITISGSAANMPTIASTVTVKDITIQQQATLTITGVLKLTGELIASDTALDCRNGSIILQGNTSQVLNGKYFKREVIQKLVIANTSKAEITNNISVTQSLTLEKGILNTNNKLHFTKQTILLPVANGVSILGKIRVETGLLQKEIGLHLIGNAFNNTLSKADFSRSFQLQKINLSHNKADTSLFELVDKYGAMWSFVDSFNRLQKDTVSGDANIGSQEIAIIPVDSSGFAFMSNPYLSPINTAYIQTGTSLAKYYWIWNPQQGKTGGFTCIASDQPYTLNIHEAIGVYAFNPTNNSMRISEEAKSTTWSNGIIPALTKTNTHTVSIDLLENGKMQDRFTLINADNGRNNFDSLDAPKLFNPGYNVYSKSADGIALAVDSRKLDNNAVIPLSLSHIPTGNYQFVITNVQLALDNKLVLHDRYLNKYLPLQKDSLYSFSITTDSASVQHGRFEIAENIPLASIERLTHKLVVKLYPNPVQQELRISITNNTSEPTQIRITNTSGMVIKTLAPILDKKALAKIPVSDLPNGLYILQISSGDVNQSLQFFKQ